MQTDLIIRHAREDELAEIARAEALCFSDAWSENALLSHKNSEGGAVLVAIFEGRMCGFVTARLLPPECELYRIAILPEARRRGFGRQLMDFFLQYTEENGCSACFLEVRAGNTPAVSLYSACGFREIGRRRNYYRNPTEDALLMQKP